MNGAAEGYKLLASKGTGSAIVEMALSLAGLPYEAEYIAFETLGPACARVTPYSPLGQVPVLVRPDGSALSESAAIILHLHDLAPEAGLVPMDGPARAEFFRWLVFLVATLYPTFTYGDSPARWSGDEASGAALRQSTDAAREGMWRFLEEQITPDPWFLGATFSALDLYLAVMMRWRPGRKWFAAHCPGLHAAAEKTRSLPALAAVLERNFG